MQEKKLEFFHYIYRLGRVNLIPTRIGPISAKKGLGWSQHDKDLGQSWPKKGWADFGPTNLSFSFFLFFFLGRARTGLT